MLFFPDFDLAVYEQPRIEHVAAAALAADPRSVTMAVNPRSAGGPHDFSSEGDYWWPDPQNPAAPYVQRDGLSNPDNFVAHRRLMLDMARDAGALAAAWKVTREERYANAAVQHLLAWFVHPDTRMSPHLLYAQAIKGRSTGRSIGVIDTLHLAEVALAVEALRGSAALTPAADAALTGWFRDYLHWMRTHPYGVEESKALNNHGTCWTLQAACFARLVGDEAVLAECRRRLKEEHLPNQMATDGSFPLELRRTKPYGYAIFNLDVMTALAVVLSTPDENLMTWSLPDGRSLAKGVAWLAPYLADKSRWVREVKRHQQTPAGAIRTEDPIAADVMYWDEWPVRQPCLLFGALATGDELWLATWKRLEPDPQVEEVRRNFPIREPVLWVSGQ
ncbi:Alginate lyase [Lacunisphaera limnophila]|uniref:Alginate lyase n=1 Tax=Lacunisphaera limnophila TaxID=1838286 RepID=A0A1D8ARW2_9BACT|nr:alginate lyase family protein [Lacunisphaera limnophila]AOS43634.1 Alginate lyase [Lacunisphaera limnophila]